MRRISKEEAKKKIAAIGSLIASMDGLDLDRIKSSKSKKEDDEEEIAEDED